jgi:hypothetical protein
MTRVFEILLDLLAQLFQLLLLGYEAWFSKSFTK